MKKVYDGRISYKGFGVHDSWCNIEVSQYKNGYIVVLTEPVEDSGTSVTNAYEDIALVVIRNLLPDADKEKIVWIEHYDRPIRSHFPETFEFVDLEFTNGKFILGKYRWIHIGETLTKDEKLELLKAKLSGIDIFSTVVELKDQEMIKVRNRY